MTIALAVWSTISSLELLVVAHAFQPGRPLGSDLAALAPGRLVPALLASRLSAPFVLPLFALIRLATGLALPFIAAAGVEGPLALLLATFALLTVWLAIASGGADGSDKIALVACGAAAIMAAGIQIDGPLVCLAGLIWGAGQLAIAYSTSGLAKLANKCWRDGSALVAVVTSYRAGHSAVASIVRRSTLALALAWVLMLIEALFPLALFAPGPVCLAALGVMALFHTATAFVMGLNTYPWAFIATYPCFAMANAVITRSVH